MCAIVPRSARDGIVALSLSVLALACPSTLRAQSCPENAEPYSTETTATGTVIHCKCIDGYEIRDGACRPRAPHVAAPKRANPVVTDCASAKRHADILRNQIAQQARLNEANRRFLDEWTKLGTQGRDKLVMDTLSLVAGTVAAATEEQAREVDALVKQADEIKSTMRKPFDPKFYVHLAELQQLSREAKPLALADRANSIAKLYGDLSKTPKAWEVLKTDGQSAIRTAADHNSRLNALLNQDSEIRESLAGSAAEDPRAEQVKQLWDLLGEETKDLAGRYAKYGKWFGPAARIADFAFNGAIDDLQISLSADAADQANTNAGNLAKAAGITQVRYKKAIDDLRTYCKGT